MIPEPLKDLFKSSETKMVHAIDALEGHFNTLRTGRASASLLDDVRVEAYGSLMPLAQVASLATPDSRTITVTPFDKSQMNAVERAIQMANLGLNPQSDGKMIKLYLPPLTEERRKEMVKKGHAMAEDGRVAIRNVRKHAKETIDKMKKDKKLTDDLAHDATEELQKLTDKFVAKVEEQLKKKEKEIMSI
ncbi:ribosome recycling factor [Candidatus Sumerlaeota bacterium]|nr:ribosome recycling factor [Candidatus Sumerlaeota bacterium]